MRKFIHAANAISVWVSNAALHCAPIGFYSISIFIRFILAIFGLPSLSSHLSLSLFLFYCGFQWYYWKADLVEIEDWLIVCLCGGRWHVCFAFAVVTGCVPLKRWNDSLRAAQELCAGFRCCSLDWGWDGGTHQQKQQQQHNSAALQVVTVCSGKIECWRICSVLREHILFLRWH